MPTGQEGLTSKEGVCHENEYFIDVSWKIHRGQNHDYFFEAVVVSADVAGQSVHLDECNLDLNQREALYLESLPH